MQGKIINNISNIYYVETKEKIYTCNARGKLKIMENVPVVGDNVEIEIINSEKKEAIIEKIILRQNYIKRPKIANITQMIFVISTKNPKPDLLMLDKQLAYAEYIGVKSAIVINKIDLNPKIIEEIETIYKNIGYKVIKTDAKNNIGIQDLEEVLKNNISVFSGNSGVGKSTLLNNIFKEEKTKEGVISKKNKRGKNTTTNISLYKINENEYIADTPGFSTFDVSEIESKDIAKYFKEFNKYINDCEYIGCGHIKEENCGIKTALNNGQISNNRYNNFIKIYEFLKDKEEHKW